MRGKKGLLRVLIWDAALVALAVVLATIFHSVAPVLAKSLVPAWYGAAVASAVLGPVHGMLVGFLTFLFSFLIRGMPPYPFWLIFAVELAIYGFFWGWAWLTVGRMPLFGDIVAYLSGLFAGKVVAGFVLWGVAAALGLGGKVTFWTVFGSWTISTLPGIVLMAVLLPFILKPVRKLWSSEG